MKTKIKWSIVLISLVACAAALFILLNATSPTNAGMLGVLAAFLLLFAVSFLIIFLLASSGEFLYRKMLTTKDKVTTRMNKKTVRRRIVYISVVLAFIPVVIISMQSIGQFRPVDLLLILLIEALAIFYIVKRV